MTASLLHFCNEKLLLDPAGAVFWPAQSMLIVADLHFEKSTAAAAKGSLLPPYDTPATLAKLQFLTQRYRPALLVLLGDSFHDAAGSQRLSPADRALLNQLSQEIHFIWITGNHDRVLAGLPGEVLPQWQKTPITLRHQAEQQVTGGEISGHFHPKITIPTRGRRISRPCFASDETRLILPAFGAYTGGLDVQAPAIAGLFPNGLRIFMLGQQRLFSFRLAPQPRQGVMAPGFTLRSM